MQTDKCKRCGKCCVVFNFEKQIWEDCYYLEHLKDGKTLCRIYDFRLGKHLGYFQVCVLRKDLHYNIPDCPYNKKIFKQHPAYNNDGEVSFYK